MNATTDEGPREFCESCGFNSDLYDRVDTISSQRIVPKVLAAAADGLEPSAVSARPDDTTWSIVEYVDHVREVVFGNRMAIELARDEPGVDLGDPPEMGISPIQKSVELPAALKAVENEYEQMEGLLRGLADKDWQSAAVFGGKPHSVGWFARHVLHDGLHHLADIGSVRQRLGYGPRPRTGSVRALHVSSGGVPKNSVDEAHITGHGLDGDAQADRRHHGRPVQAVCLWSTEVIEALQAAGHPIHPGAAGENITLDGLDWSELLPGSRITVGAVPLLISAHAIPCAKNAQWFSDRDFNRILHDRSPGSSRLYAIPLTTGTVAVGDVAATG